MANESQQRYLTVLLLGGVTDFAFGFVTSKTPPGIWKSTLQSAAVKVCTAHPTQDAVHCLEGPGKIPLRRIIPTCLCGRSRSISHVLAKDRLGFSLQ